MSGNQLRDRYTEILLEWLAGDRYPSTSMMDRAEAAIRDRRTAEAYVQTLLDTIAQDRYPSGQMLDRVTRLLDLLDAVPAETAG
jgi:hypothetical protein